MWSNPISDLKVSPELKGSGVKKKEEKGKEENLVTCRLYQHDLYKIYWQKEASLNYACQWKVKMTLHFHKLPMNVKLVKFDSREKNSLLRA